MSCVVPDGKVYLQQRLVDWSVPFMLQVNVDFKGDGTADFDFNIKIASKQFYCSGETITETDSRMNSTGFAMTCAALSQMGQRICNTD